MQRIWPNPKKSRGEFYVRASRNLNVLAGSSLALPYYLSTIRVNPHRRACRLRHEQIERICRVMCRIIEKAVAAEADYTRFPRTWLFHYRWHKNAQPVTIGRNKTRFDTIGGRTTAWVPQRQR